jgi:hypothetical protein
MTSTLARLAFGYRLGLKLWLALLANQIARVAVSVMKLATRI